jgi:quercetin dioxygenase-like cupin family protein
MVPAGEVRDAARRMSAPTTSPLVPLLERIVAVRGVPRTSMALVESTLLAGLMPPLHVHDEDEAFHVLEGSVTVYAGGETVELRPGDSYVAPRGVPHTHRAAGGRARWLSLSFVSSAGLYEDFVRAVGAPVGAGGLAPTAEDEAALLAFGAPIGIAVLGPPGLLPTEAAQSAA